MAPFLGALIFFLFANIIVFARQMGYASETIDLLKQEGPELVKGLTPMNTYLILNAAHRHWGDLQEAPQPVPKLDRIVHFSFIVTFGAAGIGAVLGLGFGFLLSSMTSS